MMDPIQILLLTVITILTILMVIVGWQLYQVLSQVRKMLSKINTLVDDAAQFSGNIGKSFHDLSGFSQGLKTVLGFLKVLKKKKNDND